MVRTLATELRFALRGLTQRPNLSIVAIATLALGLGLNTAIFTIANALEAQVLPVRHAGELYRLGDDANCCVNQGLQDNYSLFSTPLYQHLRDDVREFQSLAGFQAAVLETSVRRVGTPITESIPTQYVSGNYFETLGVLPAAGPLLAPADDTAGAAPVFVISHRTWTTRYGADPSVIGATFLLAGRPMTLVGVAEQPFFGETVRPDPAGLWLPLGKEGEIRGPTAQAHRPDSDWLYIIGRIATGANGDQAQTGVTAALQQWLSAQPFVSDEERATIPRRRVQVVGAAGGVRTLRFTFEKPVTVLLAMSGLVLLIAVANLANLLLARADRTQAAIRVALGASPFRLVRQALIQGVLLSAIGAVLGILMASFATRAVVALAFPAVDFLPIDLAPGSTVLLFSFGLAVVTGLVFSSAPAWAMSRVDPIESLRGGGRGGSAHAFMPRRTLVVTQVAFSMVLLAGAGVLMESLRRLEHQPLGFDPEERVVIGINPPAFSLPPHEIGGIYNRLIGNFEKIPGVAQATYALYTPMGGGNWSGGVVIAGRPPDQPTNASWNRVGPRYFELLGTRVLRGRAFDDRDLRPESRAAIINETFAQRFFAGENPLGRRLGRGGPAHASDLEIIGIVEDVKYSGAARPALPMMFIPGMQTIAYAEPSRAQSQSRSQVTRWLILRLSAPVPSLPQHARNALAEVHPDFSVTRIMTMPDQVSGNFRINRMLATLTGAYGLLAMALGILGVYGVTSFGVARRTREIGIRMALGADSASIVRGIVRGAVVQAAAGVGLGGAIAWYGARLIGGFLYGIEARDPVVLGGAAIVLLASAAAAAAVPALRASRIEPTVALRAE